MGPPVLVLAVVAVVAAAVAWAGGPASASVTDGRAVAGSTRAGEPAQPEEPGPKRVELPARRSYADQVARETGPQSGEASPRSGARGVVPNLPYSNWSWGASGYEEISETLTVIDADPQGHYYWAHSFALQGGDQGYSGLQVGSSPNGSKIALFAIWGATAAEGPSCRTFDNEGSGWTCRIDPYQWVPGRPYELRTVRDEVTAEGTWIKGTIIDVVTGAVTEIGRIRVPPTWGAMVGLSSWTEWFGPGLATCAAFPRSRVAWDVPRGTADGGRIDAPVARGTMVGGTNPIQACPSDTFITAGTRGADVQTITPTPWAPSSSWSALVDRQYRDVVGRAPTATERASWVPDLTSGRRRPGEVIAALRGSRDNATFVDPVARLYHAYFQREPDPAGLAYWVDHGRRSGRPLVAASSFFARSPEFARTYGGLSDARFVDLVYRNVLGRPGEAHGRAYWTGELASGRRSRGALMVGFSESAEHRNAQAVTIDASLLHILVLGRAPTAAELDATRDANRQGTSWATLAHTLLISDAYGRRISA